LLPVVLPLSLLLMVLPLLPSSLLSRCGDEREMQYETTCSVD
jgi:hypothetical protein